MEAIGVCGSGVFFEREVEFFGMSMSTGREMMAWYIRVR